MNDNPYAPERNRECRSSGAASFAWAMIGSFIGSVLGFYVSVVVAWWLVTR